MGWESMDFTFKIGLKLYSTEVTLLPDVLRLQESLFHFVELYVVPGSYEKTIDVWRGIDVPCVVHAPHTLHGVNLARPEKWETNLRHFNETRLFADDLGAEMIIVHGGNNGTLGETIRQIRLLNETRTVLENKPKIGLGNEACVGWCPNEFQQMAEAGVLHGVALDFVHAACAARSLKVQAKEIIKGFMGFHPKVFHLSDGEAASEKDVHLNLGQGGLNLAEFISVVPPGGLITLETPRNGSEGLKEFVEDVHFLQNLG